MGDDFFQSLEPEGGNLVQHPPFVGNAVGQNDIEGRDAIRSHDQKAVPQIVDVPDLSAVQKGYPLNFRLQKNLGFHVWLLKNFYISF